MLRLAVRLSDGCPDLSVGPFRSPFLLGGPGRRGRELEGVGETAAGQLRQAADGDRGQGEALEVQGAIASQRSRPRRRRIGRRLAQGSSIF